MKKLRFVDSVDATRQVVWDTMLGPETYRIWTAEFAEGSDFDGSWNQGDRIRFGTPDGSGMSAIIDESRPPEFLSIKHIGVIKGGIEDTDSEEVRAWAPAFEKYSFAEKGSSTEITVEMDIPQEWEEYMLQTWPKALARLKALCESSPKLHKETSSS